MMGPGDHLGDYEIVSLLGEGGMGAVYLGRDVRLARHVALKVLPEALTRDPQRVVRFEREARAASALNHPNICTIHAFGDAVADYVEVNLAWRRGTRVGLTRRGMLVANEILTTFV